jgi:hypothetical protein
MAPGPSAALLHVVCVQVTEPVSGNYYPVTAVAAIADQQVTAAVITDRWEHSAVPQLVGKDNCACIAVRLWLT